VVVIRGCIDYRYSRAANKNFILDPEINLTQPTSRELLGKCVRVEEIPKKVTSLFQAITLFLFLENQQNASRDLFVYYIVYVEGKIEMPMLRAAT
jgi:hypothetical protein